jgi:hypothetical protein
LHFGVAMEVTGREGGGKKETDYCEIAKKGRGV